MWQALEIEQWQDRRRSDLAGVTDAVRAIVERVRNEGDEALLALTRQFDRIDVEDLAVAPEEFEAAYDDVDDTLIESLAEAEARIRRFHELQRNRSLWLDEVEPGVILGVKTTPLERIGAYVPGGRASYPSTALMTTVPAQVAGVAEICVCTPPPVHPLTLVALDIAGVDECYRVGGAQAVAAMALGTETVDPVQKIVGPGNVYVTAAKMMLRDHAEIDFPAGPSEIGILADGSADPAFVAADVLAQAEHDPHAACILVTTDPALPARVGKEIERQLEGAQRREIIEAALKNSGYVVVSDIDDAIAAMDTVAPEHLSVQVTDPMTVLTAVRNAGSIFVGPYTAVAFGDYASGTNHVLPTAGYAATYSGLDVHHFCKTSSVQMISREGLEWIGGIVETLADAEGLHAHANSVRIRRKK
ncbi:histidinol dehydrogenase [Methanofollis fontis]|uniref:Histidinol dehydrogenase n=1 Tax=Methanofollis fontis TaxID=2052832 RepID=A0A483CTD2_9EURY|nr:histidinol dehydrogenase [Methanofollis fontis]TAJ44508.1 histidinol dehydrogenase [Methanofollis fontis]